MNVWEQEYHLNYRQKVVIQIPDKGSPIIKWYVTVLWHSLYFSSSNGYRAYLKKWFKWMTWPEVRALWQNTFERCWSKSYLLIRTFYLDGHNFDRSTYVVYFDQLSGACSTWKLVEILLSVVFNLFQWFHGWNQQKMSENEQKKTWFCLLLKAGWHAKAGQLPEGVPQNCIFWLILYFFNFFISFQLISIFSKNHDVTNRKLVWI